MAKSSKKSKASPPAGALANGEASNGNGHAQPAAPEAVESNVSKAKKPASRAKAPAKPRATSPKKTVGARKVKTPAEPVSALPATSENAAISDDQIRMRAYFISEHRNREGLPGDSGRDWLDAVRQLHEEAARNA